MPAARRLAVAIVIALSITALARAAEVEQIQVHGIVIDPLGKPVAGAFIAVPGPVNWEKRLEGSVVASAKSGADGKFELSFTKASVSPFSTGGGSPGADGWKNSLVVASAPGFGLAWKAYDRTEADGSLQLQLVPDGVPIEGHIIDLEGEPVAGVEVRVTSLQSELSESDVKTLYAREPDRGRDFSLSHPVTAMGQSTPIVTDNDGRFVVRGLGENRRADIYLSGKSIGFARLEVVTKRMEMQVRVVEQPSGIAPKYTTYGAKFDFTAVPGRSVVGVVKDADTGAPMKGVRIQSKAFAGPFNGFDPRGLIDCISDAQGHYELHGFPKGPKNAILATPNDSQAYFMQSATVDDAPGLAPVEVSFSLHKGHWVTGRVTDKANGAPLPARLMYTTLIENEHTRALPEFSRENGGAYLQGYESRYETKSNGSYRVVAVPGQAIVSASCMLPGYRSGSGFDKIELFKQKNAFVQLYQPAPYENGTSAVITVDVPENGDVIHADLQVDPGESIDVRVVNSDGTPALGPLSVRGQDAENYGGAYFKPEASTFEARAFSPDESRDLIVIDEARKLGAVVPVKVKMQRGKPLEVMLWPLATIKGRAVNANGDPLTGSTISITGEGGRNVRSIETDADGRFEASVPIGTDYGAMVSAGPSAGAELGSELRPGPGKTIDLGDVSVATMMKQ